MKHVKKGKNSVLLVALFLVFVFATVPLFSQTSIWVKNNAPCTVTFTIVCNFATGGPWTLAPGGSLLWGCPPGESLVAFGACGGVFTPPGKIGFTPIVGCPGGCPSKLYYDLVSFTWTYVFY